MLGDFSKEDLEELRDHLRSKAEDLIRGDAEHDPSKVMAHLHLLVTSGLIKDHIEGRPHISENLSALEACLEEVPLLLKDSSGPTKEIALWRLDRGK
jgi:hypothetical protein